MRSLEDMVGMEGGVLGSVDALTHGSMTVLGRRHRWL